MWDRQEGLPFLSKKLLLLRLWEVQRSNVPSAHSLQHTKPSADKGKGDLGEGLGETLGKETSLAGSQSLRQLDGNCWVFATQLPSKLIRESWLTSPATI
ncbi:hypothetical protein NQZ68_005464, partial [Dissostichus eleginoides]